jgi:hypothetical protein
MSEMRGVRFALAAGLALTGIGVGLALTRSPASLARINRTTETPQQPIAQSNSRARYCQGSEVLPARTTAIRVSLTTSIGPRVRLQVRSGQATVASGEQARGWNGGVVTVPVRPLPAAVHAVEVCVSFEGQNELLTLHGQSVAGLPPTYGPQGALAGSMRLEYLRAGTSSWASKIPTIVAHMGLARALEGSAIAYLALALALAVAALVAHTIIRELPTSTGARQRAALARRRPAADGLHAALRVFSRVPRAAWMCALVAALNAACWSIVTPPFQVPDEPAHVAYVTQLAETGQLPTSSSEQFSPEEIDVLQGVRHYYIAQQPEHHTVETPRERSELRSFMALAKNAGGSGSPAAGVAASQPPLYYALEAVPYELARAGTLLDRLALMRLLSALMAGATALFVFLFLREALPEVPWAWTVGALAVALVPLLSFMSGAVNPDSLLFAVSAATFYCLARAFRCGLSPQAAAALGMVTATGTLTKVNFLGLVPGIVLGACLLAVRERRAHGASVARLLTLTLGIGFAPSALYVLRNAISGHHLLGIVSSGAHTLHGSPLAEIDYIWQLYLPRLPGTTADFPGLFTAKDLWFHGYVGLLGWFDATFPGWVYTAALFPAGAIALLCARTLLDRRVYLRERAGELGVYAAMSLGLLVLIGADSYHEFPTLTASYAQARYLLPLLPLLGAALALGARGAGRRWGLAAGTLIVVLFMAHDIFSQMLVVARYYT